MFENIMHHGMSDVDIRRRNTLRKKLHRHMPSIVLLTIVVVFVFWAARASATSASRIPVREVSSVRDWSLGDEHKFRVTNVVDTTTTTVPKPSVTQAVRQAPSPVVVESISSAKTYSLPSGSHTDWMSEAGIPESDWGYVDHIISHESGWRPDAVNGSGCIGLGQNCPSNGKYFLKEYCPDWDTNPVCQLRRWTGYAAKYGGWQGAYGYWLSNGNW